MKSVLRLLGIAALMCLAATSVSANSACELACYGEQSQCASQYCGWNYDWYWCTGGRDQILGQCIQDCEDFGGPPTCEVGIIDTWTTTDVLSETGAFNACSGNPGTLGVTAQRVTQNLRVRTWRRWQWEDCTTSTQLVSTNFSSVLCERITGFFCGMGGGTVPACF